MNTVPDIPQSHRVAEIIRAKIFSGEIPPGSRTPSLSELTSSMKTGTMVVRSAMKILEKEGLIEKKHGSGTYVKDALSSRHIALMTELDISQPGTSYYFHRVLHQLRNFFRSHGMQVQHYFGNDVPGYPSTNHARDELLSDVEKFKVRAAVVLASHPDLKWTEKLEERGIPVAGPMEQLNSTVILDIRPALEKTVSMLARAGHKRIAFMAWDRTFNGLISASLRTNRIGLRENWFYVRHDNRGDVNPGYSGFLKIWDSSRTKPGALVVTDDCLFRDTCIAIQQKGIEVPKELEVVTMNNRGSGIFAPFPVTYLEIDPDDVAFQLGKMVLDRLDGKICGKYSVVVPYQIIAKKAGQDALAWGENSKRQ